jgi:glutathione peroxidase
MAVWCDGFLTREIAHLTSCGALADTSPMRTSWLMPLLAYCCASVLAAATPLQEVPLRDIDGKETSLKTYSGKVLLIVNVASQCGLTPQYKALESIHRKYSPQGFTVVAFPSNDFGAQEPGTNEEIKQFCSARYNVTFPLFDKIHVKGPGQHPLYKTLTGAGAAFPGDIAWNFGKFLVGRDGKVLARFEPKTKPDSPEVIKALEAALAAKQL